MDQNEEKTQEEISLEEAKKQAEEYLAGWKRSKADFINLQRETQNEIAEAVKYASGKCLRAFLPIVDTVSAGAEHSAELAALSRKIDEFLSGEGAAEIPCEGKFDPMRHEVVSKEDREGVESGTILSVVQKGYELHGRLLRAAKVIIAS